jgi:hypothetical protein
MEALGREFNVLHTADGVWVPLKDAGGVTFSCYLGGGVADTYTLQQATDAAGTGAVNLVTIERYHTSNGVGGVWTTRTQAAAATVTTTTGATLAAAVIEVEAPELSAGFGWVKLTSTGAGLVTAILRDLHVQRKPSNLTPLV